MKVHLALKMRQQLALTPQLQQAIKLLQMSTFDLQQEIQQMTQTNPMLEIEYGHEYLSNSENETGNYTDLSITRGKAEEENQSELQENWQNSIPEDLPIDSSWNEVYTSRKQDSNKHHEFNEYDFSEKRLRSSIFK